MISYLKWSDETFLIEQWLWFMSYLWISMDFSCSDQISLHWLKCGKKKRLSRQFAEMCPPIWRSTVWLHLSSSWWRCSQSAAVPPPMVPYIITQCTKTGKCAWKQVVSPHTMLSRIWLWRSCRQRPKNYSTSLQFFSCLIFLSLSHSKLL